MNRQGGIIGFNDGVWHFRGRNNAKRVHNTVGVFLTDLWNQKSPHSWACATSERVCELKSLQTITAFRFFSNNVKYRIYELGAFCVMAFRPVITSTALSCIVKTKKKKETQRAISSGFATPVTGFLSLWKGSHEKQFIHPVLERGDQFYFLSPLLHVSLWSSCKTGWTTQEHY